MNFKYALMTTALVLMPFQAQAYQSEFDGLLNDHVSTTTNAGVTYNAVDYDSWSKDPRHKTAVTKLKATNPDDLKSDDAKMAYWINAYNLLTIDLITREGERESIKNLGGLLSSPWKKHKWDIAGSSYSLDNIEHDIIRPMGDARIHFAVNCAAISCPDLRAEAYTATDLDKQLDDQVKKTFNNASKGMKYDADDNSVYVTKVMDWYREDFEGGDLNSWIQSVWPDVINDMTTIKFFKYNWDLNKQ